MATEWWLVLLWQTVTQVWWGEVGVLTSLCPYILWSNKPFTRKLFVPSLLSPKVSIKVYTTHYYKIGTFMVDRLAGQNTLTALSHIFPLCKLTAKTPWTSSVSTLEVQYICALYLTLIILSNLAKTEQKNKRYASVCQKCKEIRIQILTQCISIFKDKITIVRNFEI